MHGVLQVPANHYVTDAMEGAVVVSSHGLEVDVYTCILQVTANHYFTDAMAGAVVVGISYLAAMYVPEFGRGATADWGPALHWLTGLECCSSLHLVLRLADMNKDRSSTHRRFRMEQRQIGAPQCT